MNQDWKRTFTGSIGGRPVETEVYVDGGYRVRTTQGADSPGTVDGEPGSLTVIPPTEKGTTVEIDGDTLDEVRDQLIEEGFTEAEAIEIVGHLK